jgi:hypothetical protein
MVAAKAQNWPVEPQGKKLLLYTLLPVPIYIANFPL